MKLSRYEQETILNFNDKEKTASVYTHNRALQRGLQKLVEERPEECKLDGVCRDGQAVSFHCAQELDQGGTAEEEANDG